MRLRTRRSFLDMLLGTTITATVGSVLYPIIRYLKPLPATGATGPIRLGTPDIEKLRVAKFVIVMVASKRVMVFRDPKGALRGVDARCTHEGCTVQYVAGESAIWCACHNARFDVNGKVLSGPPPRPLPKYLVHEEADGGVIIDGEIA